MASSSAPQPQLQPGSRGRRLRAVRVGLRPAVSSSPASDRAVHRAAGAAAGTAAMPIAPSRPALKERRFTSEAVEAAVVDIGGRMADEQLGCLFANTLPNTLDTTVYHHAAEPAGLEDSFIITGDIPAMWLRDSTNQVNPYHELAPKDPKLAALLRGVVNRQTDCLLLDVYANAFNIDVSATAYETMDASTTGMLNQGARGARPPWPCDCIGFLPTCY